MIFFIAVEVDEYKQRYSGEDIIEAACQGIVDNYSKMAVSANVTVSPDMVCQGLKS